MNNKCMKLKSICEKCNSSTDYCEAKFSSCFKICSCLEDFVGENKMCVPINLIPKPQETIIRYKTYIDFNIITLIMSFIIIIIIIIIAIAKTKADNNEENHTDLERAFYNNITPCQL